MPTIIDTTFECEGVNWQGIKNIILGRGKGWPKVCLPFPRNKERKHLPLLLNIIRLVGGFPCHAVDKLNKIFINYTYIATKEIIDILGAISLPIKNVAEP